MQLLWNELFKETPLFGFQFVFCWSPDASRIRVSYLIWMFFILMTTNLSLPGRLKLCSPNHHLCWICRMCFFTLLLRYLFVCLIMHGQSILCTRFLSLWMWLPFCCPLAESVQINVVTCLSELWNSLWWLMHVSYLCIQEHILWGVKTPWGWWYSSWCSFCDFLDSYPHSLLQICYLCVGCWW